VILRQGGLEDQHDAEALLGSLKRAVAEYASLSDALSIIGDRTAYMVHVNPSAKAHDDMRAKVLSKLDNPVFVSRPLLELFDGVDPTADTGGGSAAYSLKLDRKCYWRLASLDDRRNVDFANNTSNGRMKWQSFEPGQLISWKPIALTRKNGKVDAAASFDIAVVLDKRAIVFRNQSVLVGDSRQQILAQGGNYITKALHLRIEAVEDAISVRKQDEQFTGALRYSYLADQVKLENAGNDKEIQMLDIDAFAKQRAKEDDF
jgi:hypothetical protein